MNWPWSGDYDFNAADNLCNALRNGGDQLATLVANRSKWANKYLASDPQVSRGWVGKTYNNWRADFDQAQFLLGKFANELHARAVEINNFSATKAGPNTSRKRQQWIPQRDDLSLAGKWAPVNRAPNNMEGATPQNLYDYSDNATKANDDNFRTLFTKKLAAAAAAAPVADTAPTLIGTPSAASLASSVYWCLRNQVLVVDAGVRMVGEAFELADGDSGQDPTPANQRFLVGAPDLRSINQVKTDTQQADDLAKGVLQNGNASTWKNVWQQLANHQNDPVFAAAFLNALAGSGIPATPVGEEPNNWYTLNDLLHGTTSEGGSMFPNENENVVVTTLVNGYASGELSQATKDFLNKWAGYGTNDNINSILYPELIANPQAALNFINSLPQSELAALASGAYLGNDPSGEVGEASSFMNVCASALNAIDDPSAMVDLMNRVCVAYSGYTPSDIGPMMPAITNLLATFDSRYLTYSPTGPDMVDSYRQLGGWPGKYALKFAEWIYNANSTDANNAAFARQLAENIGASAALALISFPAGAPAVLAAAISAAVTNYVIPQADAALNPTNNAFDFSQRFVHAQKAAADLALVTDLYSKHELLVETSTGLEEITPESTGDYKDNDLLNWALTHQDKVYLKGDTSQRLDYVIGAVNDNFS